jgi:hypothetical protein
MPGRRRAGRSRRPPHRAAPDVAHARAAPDVAHARAAPDVAHARAAPDVAHARAAVSFRRDHGAG